MARCLVSGYRRVPAPPPRMTAATLLVLTFSLCGGASGEAGGERYSGSRSRFRPARHTVVEPPAVATACAVTAACAPRCRRTALR